MKVPLIARTLAGDETTPGHVLSVIAGALPELHAQLAIHPNLPEGTETPGPPGRSDFWHAEQLHDALTSPALTDAARALVLSQTGTTALHAYATTWDALHPDVLTELESRTPDGPERLSIERALAVHHATTPARRVAALRAVLSSDPVRAEHDAGVEQLIASALRHPGHLRDLAAAAANADVTAELLEWAELADSGHDIVANYRSHVLRTAAAAPGSRGRVAAIRSTGDPEVAYALLTMPDAAGQLPDHWASELASAIQGNRALRDSPVARHAHLILHAGLSVRAAEHAAASHAATALAVIVHGSDFSAHEAATSARPGTEGAAEQVLAGWARLHHGGDQDNLLDDAQLSDIHHRHLAVYALHPDLPARHRRAAAAAHHRTRFTHTSYDRERVSDLTLITERAADRRALHRLLLDLPLPRLAGVSTGDSQLERLLLLHLGHALRPYHRVLQPDATRTLLALAANFPGSTRELLDSAHAVAA